MLVASPGAAHGITIPPHFSTGKLVSGSVLSHGMLAGSGKEEYRNKVNMTKESVSFSTVYESGHVREKK